MTNPVLKLIDWISIICGVFAVLVMASLVLLTTLDVGLRFFFNAPIIGSYEITEFLLILLVFFSIPWAARERANIRVDLIVAKLKRYTRARMDVVSCILSMIITALFAIATIPQARHMRNLGDESDMLEIPLYPFYFLVAIGFIILFMTLIPNLIDLIKESKKDEC